MLCYHANRYTLLYVIGVCLVKWCFASIFTSTDSYIVFYMLTGKDRVIFVTEEDHNGQADVPLPDDDEAPRMYGLYRIMH